MGLVEGRAWIFEIRVNFVCVRRSYEVSLVGVRGRVVGDSIRDILVR